MDFGDQIRIAREHMEISQELAAKAIRDKYGVRISSAYLSMIERGERTNITTNLESALKNFFNIDKTSSAISEYTKNLGSKIRELRNNANVTQPELANYLGLDKTTISNYETGYSTPDIGTIIKIAKYFNVTIDVLLGSTPDSKQNQSTISLEEPLYRSSDVYGRAKELTDEQVDTIIDIMDALIKNKKPKNKTDKEPVIDKIADLPYWHLRLQALRKERGLTVEEAATQIDPFFTPEKLQAYEDGREIVEPKYQDKLGKFYNVSWAFISARTNKRLYDAGPAIGSLEAAHRIDDPSQPLPLDAERRVNMLKKKRGLYVEEEGEDGK